MSRLSKLANVVRKPFALTGEFVTVSSKLAKSKTFWLNLCIICTASLDIVNETGVVKENAELFAMLAAVSNIVMRYFTSVPLKNK